MQLAASPLPIAPSEGNTEVWSIPCHLQPTGVKVGSTSPVLIFPTLQTGRSGSRVWGFHHLCLLNTHTHTQIWDCICMHLFSLLLSCNRHRLHNLDDKKREKERISLRNTFFLTMHRTLSVLFIYFYDGQC